MDLVLYFVFQGANDWDGGLRGAAYGGHMDLVLFFVSQGANDMNWAMCSAAAGGHMDLVHYFVDKGASDFKEAICQAARRGHKDIVFYLSQGVNDWSELNSNPASNKCVWNSAMRWAAAGGHLDLVRYFVSLGANDWSTAMHNARFSKHGHLIEYFQKQINE